MIILLLSIVASVDPENQHLVDITVSEDVNYTRAHTIAIIPNGSDHQSWVAVRRWDGGSQQVTSDECPALVDAVQDFENLPPIDVSPPVLTAMRNGSWPIGPIMLDGFSTSLSFQTTTADGSTATLQISGGNAYRLWGHRTVAALIGCWGPLTP